MRILKDFCAIDFETMTPKRSSACSIGMAKVRDGEIVETFHSLIKPVPDDSKRTNTFVHGITPEMVEHAPTFDKIWDKVQSLIEEFPLVAHYSEFDKSVFSNLLNHYNLADPDLFEFQCTFKLTGLKLELACQAYDIDIETHHNAEKDAIMCAKVYLKVREKDPDKFFLCDYFEETTKKTKRSLDKKTLNKLEDSKIVNKNTPFYNQKVVITGVFLNYPDRNELAQKLMNFGADIVSSISSKTNIVIVGADAGPSKLRKIDDFNSKGANIRIIREMELKEILDNVNNDGEQKYKFKDKKVTLGGSFESFSSNKDVVSILEKLGAKVDDELSENSDFLLMGKKRSYVKMVEFLNLNFEEEKIEWIDEEDFINFLVKNYPELVNIKIVDEFAMQTE